jgi:hypothetical protein
MASGLLGTDRPTGVTQLGSPGIPGVQPITLDSIHVGKQKVSPPA